MSTASIMRNKFGVRGNLSVRVIATLQSHGIRHITQAVGVTAEQLQQFGFERDEVPGALKQLEACFREVGVL